jgi:SAM-dependent methyltransferase
MKFKEHKLAHQLLDGLHGLEIGAATHNPFGLNTRNVAPQEDYEHYATAQQQLMDEQPAHVDIWATAEAIPVPSDSEDFILSSHVVEHLPNIISAFLEWNRIARASGIVFMIVPVRGALPADANRPYTSLEHIIDDYRQQTNVDTHPIDGVPGGRFGHYHVLTPDLLIAAVRWMNREGLTCWQLVGREDTDTKVGNGFTLAFRVLAKTADPHFHELRTRKDLLPLSEKNINGIWKAGGRGIKKLLKRSAGKLVRIVDGRFFSKSR